MHASQNRRFSTCREASSRQLSQSACARRRRSPSSVGMSSTGIPESSPKLSRYVFGMTILPRSSTFRITTAVGKVFTFLIQHRNKWQPDQDSYLNYGRRNPRAPYTIRSQTLGGSFPPPHANLLIRCRADRFDHLNRENTSPDFFRERCSSCQRFRGDRYGS